MWGAGWGGELAQKIGKTNFATTGPKAGDLWISPSDYFFKDPEINPPPTHNRLSGTPGVREQWARVLLLPSCLELANLQSSRADTENTAFNFFNFVFAFRRHSYLNFTCFSINIEETAAISEAVNSSTGPALLRTGFFCFVFIMSATDELAHWRLP